MRGVTRLPHTSYVYLISEVLVYRGHERANFFLNRKMMYPKYPRKPDVMGSSSRRTAESLSLSHQNPSRHLPHHRHYNGHGLRQRLPTGYPGPQHPANSRCVLDFVLKTYQVEIFILTLIGEV